LCPLKVTWQKGNTTVRRRVKRSGGEGRRLHGRAETKILRQDLRASARPDRHPGRCPRGQVQGHRLPRRRGELRAHPGKGDSCSGEAAPPLPRAENLRQRPDGDAGDKEILSGLRRFPEALGDGRDQARV